MRYLVTGGAGFIGANAADRLLDAGEEVIVLDNLSRPGSERNLAWLRERHRSISFEQIDVRDFDALGRGLERDHPVDVVYHLAAQVAVTFSVQDPATDFEVNARGTLNLLEAVRASGNETVVLYTSTNKVYGALEQVEVVEETDRYRLSAYPEGLPETAPLDFHSPYGCSKGAADQYVRDYQRIYGLPTIVFRNSCIYGPRQFGIEDQGWLAWFMIASELGRPITIYGNGKQVRDVLFIDDLLEAMQLAVRHSEATQGQVYNIGGGPQNSLAIWREFGPMLESLAGRRIEPAYTDWRPGDQPVYISDIRKAEADFGWKPRTGMEDGLRRLYEWVSANRSLFADTR